MKIGLDYWNVCSHHPGYFRDLAAACLDAGGEIHVISAIGRSRAGTIADEVRRLGIPCSRVHELVFRHPRESPLLKLKRCQSLGLTVFYDDRDDVCDLLTANGILAMRVTRPERVSDIGAERR